MPPAANFEHRWAVILAGGDGTRLRSFSRRIAGDDRPKQFCTLWGRRTLLSHTRRRVNAVVPAERTLLVLNQEHQPYFERELAAEPAAWTIVQPSNRGTAAAILWSLLRLAELDWDAVAAFFPSDHYYAREERFRGGLRRAFETAEADPQSAVLVGAEADRAEVSYGWIETERQACGRAARIRRFWEKPEREVAEELLHRRCLWSTFIMVGSVRVFLEMMASALPGLFHALYTHAGTPRIAECYDLIEPADFSRQVLPCNLGRLLATSLGDAGWSDLGEPSRARAVLFRKGVHGETGRLHPAASLPHAAALS